MSDQGSHAFLGEEFLTWLWWRIETDGGEFELSRGRRCGIVLDDMLSFAPRHDDDTQQTLKKGLPTRTPAARSALRHGSRVAKAKLAIAVDGRQWSVTLDGGSMNLGSVRLPDDDEDASSGEERSHGRIENFLELHEIVQEVYGQFLRVRLRPEYLEREGAQQATWMQQ